MADIVVETGAGLTTSNAYISLDDADVYHEMRLHVTDWTSAGDDTKEAALMWASGLLDTLVDWAGLKVSTTQAMRWPRSAVYDLDGDALDSDDIPKFLEDATAEYARLLIADDVTAVNDLAGFKMLQVDVIKIEVDKYDRTGSIPPLVWDMIKNYGSKLAKQSRILERV